MREPYPFRGLHRWLLLPTWMLLAGVASGIAGALIDGRPRDLAMRSIFGAVRGLTIGVALALGPRPILSVPAAAALSLSEPHFFSGLMTGLLGIHAYMDTSWPFAAVRAAGAGAMTFAHLLFLKLRGAAGLVYLPAAALSPALGWMGGLYASPFPPFIFAMGQALASYVFMVLAARTSEAKGKRS